MDTEEAKIGVSDIIAMALFDGHRRHRRLSLSDGQLGAPREIEPQPSDPGSI
jgi:hypothetical protein